MSYQLPPDVENLINQQMVDCGYDSADELLRHALAIFAQVKARQEQLLAEVQEGIKQADDGLARPLDVDALIERCTRKLAEESIVD